MADIGALQLHHIFHTFSGCKPQELIGDVKQLLTTEGIGFGFGVHTVHHREGHHFLLLGEVLDMLGKHPHGSIHGAIALSTSPFPYGLGEQERLGVLVVRAGDAGHAWFDCDEVAYAFEALLHWEAEIKQPFSLRLLRCNPATPEGNVIPLTS